MFGIIQAVLAFILLIGILVFIHELGHFVAARWCGMRADVFAIGMGPRLFGWNRKTGFTFGKLPEDLELDGDTDYRISAFPIGGYVKILGMVDESMDTDFADKPPQPWEFRSKSSLQKAFVISAGVIMNFLLAIVLFAGINFFQGKELWKTTTVGYLPKDNVAATAGLQEGDKVLQVNGKPVEHFEEISRAIYVDNATDDIALSIERNGMPLTVNIPRTNIPTDIQKSGPIIPNPTGLAVQIIGIVDGSPADEAGLEPQDVALAMDGRTIASTQDFITYVGEHKSQPIDVKIKRGDETLVKVITPGDDGKFGVNIQNKYTGPVEHVSYGFFAAIGSGYDQTVGAVGNIIDLIGSLFTGKAKLSESVGGPGTIAKYAGDVVDLGLVAFLNLMAILSVTLAFMNILPVPALDGGHLVFIIIEAIIRREIPTKVRIVVQQAGFALLIIFMAFVLYNDAVRLIGN